MEMSGRPSSKSTCRASKGKILFHHANIILVFLKAGTLKTSNMILRGMSGHQLGRVCGIIWGMSGTSSGHVWGMSGACLGHCLGHHLGHVIV